MELKKSPIYPHDTKPIVFYEDEQSFNPGKAFMLKLAE